MAIYPKPPTPFVGPTPEMLNSAPQTGAAAYQASNQPPAQSNDLLQNFLSQLQKMMGDPEEQLQQPGPVGWQEQLQLAAKAPYEPTAGPDYALQRSQQNRDIANENVRMRNRSRQQKIDDLRGAAGLAAMIPGREAQAELARARTEHLLNPAAGDDKVMIQVTRQDPQTGQKTSQWIPRAVARQMYYAGEAIEVVSGVPPNAFIPTSEGYFAQPRYGPGGFLGGGNAAGGGRLYPPLSPGMANTGIQNVETVAASAGLKQAWLAARQELGIDKNPGLWDSFRYSLSDSMSRTQFWRNPGAFARTMGFDPQAVLRYRSVLARNLNGYIKAQTGAQFSVAELEKYSQQFPLPMDDEATFDNQLRQIQEPAIQRLNDLMRLYGGAAGLLRAARSNPAIAEIVDIDDLQRSVTLKPPAANDFNDLVR